MHTRELRLRSRFQSLARVYRARWFPCAALIVIACAQTLLAVLLVPEQFGTAPVQRAQDPNPARIASPEKVPRAVKHDSPPAAIPASPRGSRSVPQIKSPLP